MKVLLFLASVFDRVVGNELFAENFWERTFGNRLPVQCLPTTFPGELLVFACQYSVGPLSLLLSWGVGSCVPLLALPFPFWGRPGFGGGGGPGVLFCIQPDRRRQRRTRIAQLHLRQPLSPSPPLPPAWVGSPPLFFPFFPFSLPPFCLSVQC